MIDCGEIPQKERGETEGAVVEDNQMSNVEMCIICLLDNTYDPITTVPMSRT